MEMKKLHMGTVSYGFDSMDEVAHQLVMAFGSSDDDSHKKQNSLATGAQLASRGRRDMSSRVHDVVLSLALCHNVRICAEYALFQAPHDTLGDASNQR